VYNLVKKSQLGAQFFLEY